MRNSIPMATEARKLVSPEEYLELERAAETRHEYIDGEIVAMAGAGLNHNLIVSSLIGNLYNLLKGKNCNIFPSDMRLHIPVNGLYTYPDVMVACGQLEFTDEKKDTLTSPSLIVEVLSPSTEDYDRGGKFMRYRSIPSLQEYLLIDSTGILAEKFARDENGNWFLNEYRDRNAIINLKSLNVEISLAEIYARTEAP